MKARSAEMKDGLRTFFSRSSVYQLLRGTVSSDRDPHRKLWFPSENGGISHVMERFCEGWAIPADRGVTGLFTEGE